MRKKKNPLFESGWGRKNRPSFCHHLAIGEPVARFSVPPSHSRWILIIQHLDMLQCVASVYGQSLESVVLIAYALRPPIIAHSDIFSWTRSIKDH